jgi:hypothetical protein
MKIGILTYHDGINFGAYLQVFSLYTWFKENTNHDIQVINFKDKFHSDSENEYFLGANYKFRKHPFKLLKDNMSEYKRLQSNKRKIRRFKKAHKLLNLTKFTHKIRDVEKEKYDLIVVGSDEIWNYTNSMIGYVPAYFGNGYDKRRIVSYAASFGSVNAKDNIKREVLEGIKDFDELSVRDLNTEKIVIEKAGKNPTLVCDPVFLIDHKKYIILPNESKPFLLIYGAEGYSMEEREYIISYSSKRNLKLISIGYVEDWCHESIVEIGPFEFLGYFKKADKIVTKMFHGTLFSILFEKQFCTLCTPYRENKFGAIMKKTELQNRLLIDAPIKLEDTLDRTIDYSKATPLLNRFISESTDYLNRIVSE